MSYDLLRDPSSESVALVDAEIGRALGPILSGPDAERVMEAFVGALGVDPAKLEHWEIQMRFNQYLEALQGDVEPDHPVPADDPTPSDPAEVVVPTAPPAGQSNGSATTSPPDVPVDHEAAAAAAADEAIAASADPPPPQPADTDPTSAAPSAGGSVASPASPGEGAPSTPEPTRPSVPADRVTCPQCEGWGTVAQGGQVVGCPLCEASGSVTPEVNAAYHREQAAG